MELNYIVNFETTILMIGLVGLLQFTQLLVADVSAIKSKKIPGFPTKPDHNSFVFSSERAFLNTSESVTIFLMFACFSILSSADPGWLNSLSVIYALSRLFHMFFYYFGIQLARSAVFAISLLALAGMFIVGVAEWL